MNPLEITLVILLVTIIAFVSGKVPFSVISTGIILALILTGIKTPAEAFGGFINTNVVKERVPRSTAFQCHLPALAVGW